VLKKRSAIHRRRLIYFRDVVVIKRALAIAYGALGDREATIEWLQRCAFARKRDVVLPEIWLAGRSSLSLAVGPTSRRENHGPLWRTTFAQD